MAPMAEETRQSEDRSPEDLLERIDAAVEDYQRFFPPPYSLAPNLQLALEAATEIARLRKQLQEEE